MKVKEFIKHYRVASDINDVILIPDGAPKVICDSWFLRNPAEYSEGDSTLDSFEIKDGDLVIWCH